MNKVGKCAIVLAAGMGSRLGHDHPKVLTEIRGKSLLARHREALAEHGFDHQIWAVGHEHERIRRALSMTDGAFEIVCNEIYASSGSGYSLLLALDMVPDACLFMDADILYEKSIFSDLDLVNSSVLYSAREALDEEMVKVYASGSRLTGLRKAANPGSTALGEAIGMVVLSPDGVVAMREACRRALDASGARFEWETVLERLSMTFPIQADERPERWIEIDFPADLESAIRMADELNL